MADLQNEVNRLSFLLRLQVIEYLVTEDRIKFGAAPLSDEEMIIIKRMINRLPCCTKRLKDLFIDAHRMQEDKGMFPHAANVGELEWCLKNRQIGYSCIQRVKQPWLPYKEDKELRMLPAFKALTQVYKPLIAQGKPPLPPVDEERVQEEALAIVNHLTAKLTTETKDY